MTTADLDRALSRAFVERHPIEAAGALEALGPAEGAALVRSLPPPVAAPSVGQMTPSAAAELLRTAGEPAAAILGALDLDGAAAILRRMPAALVESLLASEPLAHRALLRRLVAFPADTAGALMDPLVLALADDIDVAEAMRRVDATPEHVIYYLYTIDRRRRLTGVLSLRELMLAPGDAPLRSIARREVAHVPAGVDRQAIVAHPGWGEFHALPVVDHDGTYLGAIRYETLRRLEMENRTAGQRPVAMAVSLGQLYWTGLLGLLEGLASTAGRGAPRPGEEQPDGD
jgi:magnesium transporter